MIAISDSRFNLIYLLKRLQGFEGRAQCVVISLGATQRNLTPTAGDGSSLGFLLHLHCLYYADISGTEAVFSAFREGIDVFLCKISTAMKPLSLNGHHSVGHIKDAFGVEHQFSCHRWTEEGL